MHHTVHTGLTALETALSSGFELRTVDSSDTHLILEVNRGSERRRIRLDRDDARELLADGFEIPEPIPA